MDDRLYIKEADGIRALCVLGVMSYHIWQQSWLSPCINIGSLRVDLTPFVRAGYEFVDLMLMLSGFLLFLPCAVNALQGKKQEHIGRFYLKRFARIVPAYLLVIAVCLVIAVRGGEYRSGKALLRDLIPHLTFTHVWFPFSYNGTHLNTALWTLAVEMEFYLIFPLVGRCFAKKPLITYLVMVGAAFFYRRYVTLNITDTTLYINQLPAMLDVYANGCLAAYVCACMKRQSGGERAKEAFFTVCACVCAVLIWKLFQSQSYENGYDHIRLGQMNRRFPLSFAGALLLLSLSLSVKPLRFVFGNPVSRFLSAISYEMYLWHSVVMLRLKAWRIPAYAAAVDPQMNNEPVWQLRYTVLCFAASIALAALITYLYEKPLTKIIGRIGTKKTAS